MEQRISFITLGVRDLARSLAFYEGALGWKPSSASKAGAIAFFDAGGLVFALFPREELAKDAAVSGEGSGFGGFALAHNVREKHEVDAILEAVQARGGTLLKPAHDTFWGGYSGYFADPDGVPWEVCWNPGMPLDERGIPQLPA